MRVIHLSILILIGAIVATSSGSAANRSENLKNLINSEREFAQRAKIDGMQVAFLSTLADNAVVFRPLPVNGKLWYHDRGPTKALLVWEPIFADVSAAGDLGYTTGPWEYFPEGEGSEDTFFGHYLSVWRKTLTGGWAVVIDIGVNHDGPYAPEEMITASSVGTHFDREEGWSELADLEASLTDLTGDELREHYATLFDDDIRFYRNGITPQVGLNYATAALKELPSEIDVSTLEVVVSESGDIGYAYGTQHVKGGSNGDETQSYLRIWHKRGDQRWHIVADFALPSK